MPPDSLEQELAQEQQVVRDELAWLMRAQVEPVLVALRSTLETCQDAVKLHDEAVGALTLAISSIHSDEMKGFVTLSGSSIVKGELVIKMPKVPVVKVAIQTNLHQQQLLQQQRPQTSRSTSASPATTFAPLFGNSATDGHTTSTSTTATTATTVTTATTTTATTKDVAHGSNPTTPLPLPPSPAYFSQHPHHQPSQPALTPGGGPTAVLQPSAPISTPVTTITVANKTNNSGKHMLGGSSSSTLANSHAGHGPLVLEQLVDAKNHISMAQLELLDLWASATRASTIGGALVKESTEKKSNDWPQIQASVGALKILLRSVHGHIQHALDALSGPKSESLYPYKVCDPKIYTPSLSEDFVIEFYIREAELVCAAYALHLAPYQASSTLPVNHHHVTSGGNGGVKNSTGNSGSGSQDPGGALSPTLSTGSGGGAQGSNAGAGSTSANNHHRHQMLSSPPRSPQTPIHVNSGTSGAQQALPVVQQQQQPTTLFQNLLGLSLSSGTETNKKRMLGFVGKGGVNKYRDKMATTVELVVVKAQCEKFKCIQRKLRVADQICVELSLKIAAIS